MTLTQLSVTDFRNIEKQTVAFSEGINLLLGQNGQGKTNLTEAIYYFARGKSFRGVSDAALCRFGTDRFAIEMRFRDAVREQTLSYTYCNGERVRRRNGVKIGRATEMLGHFRAVLFHPDHLQLVKGAPALRREFMNVALAQIFPVYAGIYSKYARALEQRNALLRAVQKGGEYRPLELEVFSERLSETAAELAAFRYRFVAELNEAASAIILSLSNNKEMLRIVYECDVEEGTVEQMRAAYLEKFSRDPMRECMAGVSLYGIHRDDLQIELNGTGARDYASQGQQRSIAIALKLAEGEIIKRNCGTDPVFLFDDVLSELDPSRRRFVLEAVGGRQLILTACESTGLEAAAMKVIKTEGGRYVEEG